MYKLLEGDSNSITDCTCSQSCPVHGRTNFKLGVCCDSSIDSDKTTEQKKSEIAEEYGIAERKTNDMETQTDDDTFGEKYPRSDLIIDESSIL